MKRKTIIKIIEIIVYLTLFLLINNIIQSRINKIKNNDIYEKIDSVKTVLENLNDSLYSVNSKLYILKAETLENTRKTEENIQKIIKKQKQLENEKFQSNQNIINSSDSADWEWFRHYFAE